MHANTNTIQFKRENLTKIAITYQILLQLTGNDVRHNCE